MPPSPSELPPTPSSVPGRSRFGDVDLLRGLVMAVMVVNHVHYYFTSPALTPLKMESTTVAQFLTAWVTHFCAPVFVLLAGTGASLRAARGSNRIDTAWFLLTRGLWIVLLEVTVVRWAWTFTPDMGHSSGQILWAIGWSMVALAGLQFLPLWTVGVFSVLLIACHNTFDHIRAEDLGVWWPAWLLAHGQGVISLGSGITFHVYYPLVPWIGVMSAGYTLGRLFTLPDARRRRWLIGIGGTLILLFLILRGANVYGDPKPWMVQPSPTFTALSFVNCTKYPPSLLYLLMTLGPALVFLAVPATWWGAAGRVLVTFGRSAMLYYLLHIPLVHGLAMAFALLRDGHSLFLVGNDWLIEPEHYPSDWGYSLWVVYAVWAGVLAALFPICRWFGRLKQRRKNWWWLSYL